MAWSDGHLEVTKKLKFDPSYIVEVNTSVTLDGMPLRNSIIWSGGFGDITAYRAAAQTQVFNSSGGKLNTLAAKNLGKPGPNYGARARSLEHSILPAWRIFISPSLSCRLLHARGDLRTNSADLVTGWTFPHQTTTDGKTETEIVPQMAVGMATPGPLDLRMYVGPKTSMD